jgi:hypothetical protein
LSLWLDWPGKNCYKSGVNTVEKSHKANSLVWLAWLAGSLICFVQPSASDTNQPEQRPPRAARSVHLAYKAPEAVVFYNELTVQESYAGSYFMACGFKHGYFGIQELNAKGDKVVIFSVWDPAGHDDPDVVDADKRVKVLYQGQDVRIRRFGGEGTGGQSMFAYQWQIGLTYKFLVKAAVEQDKTIYSAYFYLNESKQWKRLAGFQTITGGDCLKGYYSFIEDFRRDGLSATKRRRARFSNGWVKTLTGNWVALTEAAFTADKTPTTNIDAGIEDNQFYLATGGDTKNTAALWSTLSRLPQGLELPE